MGEARPHLLLLALFIDENCCGSATTTRKKSNLEKHLSPYLRHNFLTLFRLPLSTRSNFQIHLGRLLAGKKKFQQTAISLGSRFRSCLEYSCLERAENSSQFCMRNWKGNREISNKKPPRNLPFPPHTLILLLNLFPPPTIPPRFTHSSGGWTRLLLRRNETQINFVAPGKNLFSGLLARSRRSSSLFTFFPPLDGTVLGFNPPGALRGEWKTSMLCRASRLQDARRRNGHNVFYGWFTSAFLSPPRSSNHLS